MKRLFLLAVVTTVATIGGTTFGQRVTAPLDTMTRLIPDVCGVYVGVEPGAIEVRVLDPDPRRERQIVDAVARAFAGPLVAAGGAGVDLDGATLRDVSGAPLAVRVRPCSTRLVDALGRTGAPFAITISDNRHCLLVQGVVRDRTQLAFLETLATEPGIAFIEPGDNFVEPGDNFVEPGDNFIEPGTDFTGRGDTFIQTSTSHRYVLTRLVRRPSDTASARSDPALGSNVARVMSALAHMQAEGGLLSAYLLEGACIPSRTTPPAAVPSRLPLRPVPRTP